MTWARDLSIDANEAEVSRASDWLETSCREQNVPPMQIDRLVLCLTEALANVLDHGGTPDPAQPIQLHLELATNPQGHEASVTVSDAGREFNPVAAAKRVRPATLEEASPRGMGIEMIRRCSDLLRYRHEGGRNHLTFGTRWQNSTSATPR